MWVEESRPMSRGDRMGTKNRMGTTPPSRHRAGDISFHAEARLLYRRQGWKLELEERKSAAWFLRWLLTHRGAALLRGAHVAVAPHHCRVGDGDQPVRAGKSRAQSLHRWHARVTSSVRAQGGLSTCVMHVFSKGIGRFNDVFEGLGDGSAWCPLRKQPSIAGLSPVRIQIPYLEGAYFSGFAPVNRSTYKLTPRARWGIHAQLRTVTSQHRSVVQTVSGQRVTLAIGMGVKAFGHGWNEQKACIPDEAQDRKKKGHEHMRTRTISQYINGWSRTVRPTPGRWHPHTPRNNLSRQRCIGTAYLCVDYPYGGEYCAPISRGKSTPEGLPMWT